MTCGSLFHMNYVIFIIAVIGISQRTPPFQIAVKLISEFL